MKHYLQNVIGLWFLHRNWKSQSYSRSVPLSLISVHRNVCWKISAYDSNCSIVPTTVVQLVDNTVYNMFYGKRNNCIILAHRNVVLWNFACDSFRSIIPTKVAHLVHIKYMIDFCAKRNMCPNPTRTNAVTWSFVKLCVCPFGKSYQPHWHTWYLYSVWHILCQT